MKEYARTVRPTFALALSLGSGVCAAQNWNLPLNLSLQPQLFNSEFVTTEASEVREARLNSGLGLNLASRLLAIDVDYKLQSTLKESTTSPANDLSQQFNAMLHSAVLNRLLGVDAAVKADSVFRGGGDIYRYKVSPAISRGLSDLAKLSVNYDYVLDKASAEKHSQEKKGYTMLLDGSLQGGRLLWSGSYRNASTIEDQLSQTQALEALDLKSRYLLSSSIHLELSSAIKQETRFGLSGSAADVLSQKRYAAAFAWSPSEQYSLAFKLHSLEDDKRQGRETFGSGTVSWSPRPELELTLDYGEQKAADGAPGWMLHTRFDING